MALINQSDLQARIKRTLTAEEASAFTVLNDSLQASVEALIGSDLEEAGASTRVYDGGVQHLAIDPCTAVTALELVDDDAVKTYDYDTTDYTVEPANRTLKTLLRHRYGPFITGINNIRVTAKFSIYDDTKTLNIVKDAMLDALASEIQNTDNLVKESIEGYTREFATTESKQALKRIAYLFPRV